MLSKQFMTYIGQETRYDTILNGGRYKTEWKVFARKEFFFMGSTGLLTIPFMGANGLVSADVDWGIFSDSAAVGCVQARQIVVKLRTDEQIVNGNLGVDLCGRIVDNNTGNKSDWLYIGRFFISKRRRVGEVLELTCYDPVLKTQGDFFANGEDIGEWPRMMKTVAAGIASRIGCDLSIPSSLPDYPMEAPVGMTMRDVLASMAAAWGGNWTVRGSGSVGSSDNFTSWTPTLRLLPLGESLGTYDAGKKAVSMAAIGDAVNFTGVRMFWSDNDCFEAGNCNGKPLEAYCEWATQAMVNNVWSAIQGQTFRAFEASNAWLHPAIEPGDAITINGVNSQIITMKGSLNAGCAFDISFPGAEAEEDEYPYVGPVTQTLAKKVSLGRPYYGASISREQGLVIQRSDGASEAVFNSDVFSMRAKDAAGQMVDCIYFDALAQLYRITGQVEIDGALVTQNLYADEGDIVALTVDQLITSRRVSKYIMGDTSNDNYISIQGNIAKWIVAAVKTISGNPMIVQHANRDGSLLYWVDDPAGAQVVNGYYEKDGRRLTTTTTNTGWPVYVFDYMESTSLSITFGEKNPVIIFGSGDGPGTGRLQQYDGGIEFSYVDGQGNKSYMAMDALGRVFFKDSLKRVDLSQIDVNGHFTFDYGEDGSFKDSYQLTKTTTGYRLTKPGGEVLDIAT